MDEDYLDLSSLFFPSEQPPAGTDDVTTSSRLGTEFEFLFATAQGSRPLGDIDTMDIDTQGYNNTGNEGQPGLPLNTDISGQHHEHRDPSTSVATQVPARAPGALSSGSQPAYGEVYLHGYSVSELIPNLI